VLTAIVVLLITAGSIITTRVQFELLQIRAHTRTLILMSEVTPQVPVYREELNHITTQHLQVIPDLILSEVQKAILFHPEVM